MPHIVISAANKNNIYTVAFNAAAKTLTFTNVDELDLGLVNLVSVWDDTLGVYFNLQGATFSNTPAHGVPVWTCLLAQVPAGAANLDVLVTILNIPAHNAIYSILQVISGATI